MSVYTKRLLGAFGHTQTVAGVAPAGKVWIVKEVIVAFFGTPGAAASVQDSTTQTYLAFRKQVAAQEVNYLPMTQPLPAGHTLLIDIEDGSGGTSVLVSGYELVGP